MSICLTFAIIVASVPGLPRCACFKTQHVQGRPGTEATIIVFFLYIDTHRHCWLLVVVVLWM